MHTSVVVIFLLQCLSVAVILAVCLYIAAILSVCLCLYSLLCLSLQLQCNLLLWVMQSYLRVVLWLYPGQCAWLWSKFYQFVNESNFVTVSVCVRIVILCVCLLLKNILVYQALAAVSLSLSLCFLLAERPSDYIRYIINASPSLCFVSSFDVFPASCPWADAWGTFRVNEDNFRINFPLQDRR